MTARRRAPAPILLLGALSAMAPLSLDLYLPALPRLEAEFGGGQSAIQLTLTAAATGLALGQLVAGPLSDRFGRRGPTLAWLAATVLAGPSAPDPAPEPEPAVDPVPVVPDAGAPPRSAPPRA